VLTVAQNGLIHLEDGNVDAAINAGHYLIRAFKMQPHLGNGFYLRFTRAGELISQFPEDQTHLHFISANQPNQLHFMIGYPAAFLVKLYQQTQDEDFLLAAKTYLDFSLSCDRSVYSCDFSHKIAWAASLLYECTAEEKYLQAIEKITSYFIEKQREGVWFHEDSLSSFDQSAEIACWFVDIEKNLNSLKKNSRLWNSSKKEESVASTWKNSITFKNIAYSLVVGFGVFAIYKSGIVATSEPTNPLNLSI
jgi:hypothetical protein